MKHFDEVLSERGFRAPAPLCQPVYKDINVMIREAKEGLADAEWNNENHNRLSAKRTWLQFLLAEKRRGMERFLIGIESVKEITQ